MKGFGQGHSALVTRQTTTSASRLLAQSSLCCPEPHISVLTRTPHFALPVGALLPEVQAPCLSAFCGQASPALLSPSLPSSHPRGRPPRPSWPPPLLLFPQ